MQCPQCQGTGEVQGTMGMKLQLFRSRKGKSVREVSEATDISITSISSMERDTARNPSLAHVITLAKYYNTKVDDLITEENGDG